MHRGFFKQESLSRKKAVEIIKRPRMGHVVHPYKAARMREPVSASASKSETRDSGAGVQAGGTSGRSGSAKTGSSSRTVSPAKRTRPAPTESDCGKQKYSSRITRYNEPFLVGFIDGKKKDFMAASLSTNSWKRHFSAIKQYGMFCRCENIINMSVDENYLENFVIYCIERGLKIDTIKSYIGSLKLWCELNNKDTEVFKSLILKKILIGGKNLELYRTPKIQPEKCSLYLYLG
jgi:hypothetical protein